MRMPRRTSVMLAAAGLLVAALTLLGCSGSSDSGPKGWEKFSAGGWSGYKDDDWDVFQIDANSDLSVVDRLPAEARDGVRQLMNSGRVAQVTFVYLDQDPTFATNVNMIGCFTADQSVEQGKGVDTFKAAGINASIAGTAPFGGKDWELIKVALSPQTDTYQIYPNIGSCYLVVTLSTRAGDASNLQDFKDFTGNLKVNVDKLPG